MSFDYDAHAAKFSKLNADWKRQREEINADKHLSPDGRRAKLKEAHKAILDTHRALKDEFKAAVAAERDRLKRSAFSPSREADRDAHRRILAEAAAADPKSRRRLYERFDASGDRVGMNAVLAAAVEAGDHGLVAAAGDSSAADYLRFERTYGEQRGVKNGIAISMATTPPSL